MYELFIVKLTFHNASVALLSFVNVLLLTLLSWKLLNAGMLMMLLQEVVFETLEIWKLLNAGILIILDQLVVLLTFSNKKFEKGNAEAFILLKASDALT